MIFCRSKYPLREYQKYWIEEIFASWLRGNKSVLAQLPTGAGKTVCFAHTAYSRFMKYSNSNWQTSFAGV
jgi:superfamily II DNA or RNA helicase